MSYGLKGHHKIAQGNALGKWNPGFVSPERAAQGLCIAPSGLLPFACTNPGRCPGLVCGAPSGLKSKGKCSFSRDDGHLTTTDDLWVKTRMEIRERGDKWMPSLLFLLVTQLSCVSHLSSKLRFVLTLGAPLGRRGSQAAKTKALPSAMRQRRTSLVTWAKGGRSGLPLRFGAIFIRILLEAWCGDGYIGRARQSAVLLLQKEVWQYEIHSLRHTRISCAYRH
jgi:hypothetical protein